MNVVVLYRVEPGCLGPDGKSLIEAFCKFANEAFGTLFAQHVELLFVPRYDKSLAEIQYQYNGKNLSGEMAKKFFNAQSVEIDDFEEQLNDRLSGLIDTFLAR